MDFNVETFGKLYLFTFIIAAVAALLLGFKYKLAILTFFLSFTYIELMDKTTYLNHYYFITIISLVLVFLPANCYFSVDAMDEKIRFQKIPRWNIDILKLLLLFVYAGLAKLNSTGY
jgi:hypothetical protein